MYVCMIVKCICSFIHRESKQRVVSLTGSAIIELQGKFLSAFMAFSQGSRGVYSNKVKRFFFFK